MPGAEATAVVHGRRPPGGDRRTVAEALAAQAVGFEPAALARRGHAVVASDVAHHYRHFLERRLFPVVDSVAAVLEGYGRVEALVSSIDHVIPGHDPLVCELYPAATPQAGGVPIVRLRRAAPVDQAVRTGRSGRRAERPGPREAPPPC